MKREPLTLDQEGNILKLENPRMTVYPGYAPSPPRRINKPLQPVFDPFEKLHTIVHRVETQADDAMQMLTDPRMIGNIALMFLSRLK